MRIVLSFESFAGFGGTETYNLTVANALVRLGHDVAIYSPNRGAMAELAREQGVPVVGLDQLPSACDLLVCSDAATCHELAGRYRDAPTVFVAHSADVLINAPPQLADRCQAVVVLNDRVRRAVTAMAWHAPITRLRQPIDLRRFSGLGACLDAPERALVTSNYLTGPRAELIEGACRAAGLQVMWIGNQIRPTAYPEFEIARADIVIGLGRSVLEGMAAGRAAYVFGVVGGDGWVTSANYAAMEADGFAGSADRELVLEAGEIERSLREWRAEMGEANRDLASAHHSARDHTLALLELASELGPRPQREVSAADELARLIRLEWRSQGRLVAHEAESARLRSELAAREQEAAAMRDELAHSREGLAHISEEHAGLLAAYERLRSTRRYRLVSRIAKPLDRIRTALRR
jgi:hypothetical protein